MSKGYLGVTAVAGTEVVRNLGNNDLASTEIAAVAGISNKYRRSNRRRRPLFTSK